MQGPEGRMADARATDDGRKECFETPGGYVPAPPVVGPAHETTNHVVVTTTVTVTHDVGGPSDDELAPLAMAWLGVVARVVTGPETFRRILDAADRELDRHEPISFDAGSPSEWFDLLPELWALERTRMQS